MTHSFNVQGMSCEHCVRALTQAVQAVDAQAQVRVVDAQAQVRVDLAGGQVEVASEQPRERLVQAIEDEGYTVRG